MTSKAYRSRDFSPTRRGSKDQAPSAKPWRGPEPGPERYLGNQALRRLAETGSLRAKLTVGPAGDRHEQEADHVADVVMRMPDPRIQRRCAACEEEQREGELRAKAVPGRTPTVTPELEAATRTLEGRGRPMGAGERAFFEPRFRRDFGSVRIHDDARAATMARSVEARAFTLGRHVVFGDGEYSPGSRTGRHLMAHELTHVVQQRGAASGNGGATAGTPSGIQRARLPCTTRTAVDIYSVSLPGSTRSVTTDVTTASDILCQCGIEVNLTGGESWQTNLMDLDPPNGVLNDFPSGATVPTREESQMLSHQPAGAGVLHVYFVPAMSSGARGESLRVSRFSTISNNAVVVADSAVSDTFAHELGHVLLDDGGHHSDRDNLMARGRRRRVGVDELEQSQCNRMP